MSLKYMNDCTELEVIVVIVNVDLLIVSIWMWNS